MLLTEDDAKSKWCPMQRQSEQGVGGSYNRPSDGGFGCIASGCMAWRAGEPKITAMVKTGEAPADFKPQGDDWKATTFDIHGTVLPGWVRETPRGYCGLAPIK